MRSAHKLQSTTKKKKSEKKRKKKKSLFTSKAGEILIVVREGKTFPLLEVECIYTLYTLLKAGALPC